MARRTKPQNKIEETTVSYRLVDSEWGPFALVWTGRGLRSVHFPDKTSEAVRRAVLRRHPEAREAKAGPGWLQKLAKDLTRALAGGESPVVESVPLDLEGVGPFHQKIYREALKIPRGRAVSYVELARRAGSPGAARAVGQAMARNPLPLVVPCHRVLAAGGKLGGFSAPGGLFSKTKLLEMEGYCLRPRSLNEGFAPETALSELSRRDPKLGRLIREIGPFALKISKGSTPYQYLLRSIIYQQLNGRAAATIHSRVQALFGGRDPLPQELLSMKDEPLLGAGLSRNKLLALRDLARHAEQGLVPDRRKMKKMSDEEIIESLTSIRGIGRWTVEMLLIFGLGRADVLAVDDFALKKSVMLLHGLREMPNKKTFQAIGEAWRPYRTVACWYLWRALDPKPVT